MMEKIEDVNKKSKENEGIDYDSIAIELKKLLSIYSIDKWEKYIEDISKKKKFLKEGPFYQQVVCRILKNEVFKNEEFIPEEREYDIFEEFTDELNIKTEEKIEPDFIVKKITKENFGKIIENYK